MAEERPALPNSDEILQQLEGKGVYFRDLEDAPAHVVELAEWLTQFPPHRPFSDRRVSLETLNQGVQKLSYAEMAEMLHALDAAAKIKQARVLDPLGQPESAWMYLLNRPTLSAAFERSFDAGKLALMEDSLWTKGQDLQDARLQASPGFSNPKPDSAIGLAFSNGHKDGSLFCTSALRKISDAFPDFVPSPDGRDGFRTLLPGFIYEAKPDTGRRHEVKAQIALGAARALALLQSLRELSGAGSQNPVIVCMTSEAHQWNLYLATVALLDSGGMDTILFSLGSSLDISNVRDRVRLNLSLFKVNHWLVQTHSGNVEEQLSELSRLARERRRRGGAGDADVAGEEAEEQGAAARARPVQARGQPRRAGRPRRVGRPRRG